MGFILKYDAAYVLVGQSMPVKQVWGRVWQVYADNYVAIKIKETVNYLFLKSDLQHNGSLANE